VQPHRVERHHAVLLLLQEAAAQLPLDVAVQVAFLKAKFETSFSLSGFKG
jgi:hypothetical protein